MSDRNENNKRKRKEINLDMAKNGAIFLLKDMQTRHWSESYKETVRLILLFNEELDREILEGKIRDEETADVIDGIPSPVRLSEDFTGEKNGKKQ